MVNPEKFDNYIQKCSYEFVLTFYTNSSIELH